MIQTGPRRRLDKTNPRRDLIYETSIQPRPDLDLNFDLSKNSDLDLCVELDLVLDLNLNIDLDIKLDDLALYFNFRFALRLGLRPTPRLVLHLTQTSRPYLKVNLDLNLDPHQARLRHSDISSMKDLLSLDQTQTWT